MRKYPFNEDFFSKIDSEEKAYWLGFIVADGCIRTIPIKSLAINLKGSDLEHLNMFQKSIERSAPLSRSVSNFNTEVIRMQVSSGKLIGDLIQLGLHVKKSHTQAPIILSDKNLQVHFWRGLFDGDGSIHKKGKYWHISLCGNKFIVDGFQRFLIDNDLPKGSISDHYSIKKWKTGGTSNPYHIIKFLYGKSNIGLNRKVILADSIIKEYEMFNNNF